jgi:predicted nucleic acid-binding protein
MTIVVSDSGPFIHLALINQFALFQRYFRFVMTIQEVYEEVVTQGQGLPGSQELAAACEAGFVRVMDIEHPQLVAELRQSAPPEVSDIDVNVLALAVEQQRPFLSDDEPLRTFARARGNMVSGSIGLLIQPKPAAWGPFGVIRRKGYEVLFNKPLDRDSGCSNSPWGLFCGSARTPLST